MTTVSNNGPVAPVLEQAAAPAAAAPVVAAPIAAAPATAPIAAATQFTTATKQKRGQTMTLVACEAFGKKAALYVTEKKHGKGLDIRYSSKLANKLTKGDEALKRTVEHAVMIAVEKNATFKKEKSSEKEFKLLEKSIFQQKHKA
jgi:hypothetical protein